MKDQQKHKYRWLTDHRTPPTRATLRGRRHGMCFLVIEQLPGTNKACGCDHNNGNPEKDEGEPVVTAKRPRQERRPHSTSAGCRPAAAHVWSVADVAVWPIGSASAGPPQPGTGRST